ncbi:MAG: LamG domain-containing protein [Candidatus Heimdallarchaeota archaeon]|nr:LamG domain-containing protein [Candidatus Heimdallarchaeota archaeon]
MRHIKSKLRIFLFLSVLILGLEYYPSTVYANQDSVEYLSMPIEGISDPDLAMKILDQSLETVKIDEQSRLISERFYAEQDLEAALDRIDAGYSVENYDDSNPMTTQIEFKETTYLSQPTNILEEKVKYDESEVFIPGLLQNLYHYVNVTSSGKVFLDSNAIDYTINFNSELNTIIENSDNKVNKGHLGIVVFVSDYKSRSIEKLQENEVWKQVYSRLESWLVETSSYYVMMVNEYATPQNIINLLAEAEMNNKVKSIGITFVAHGVSSAKAHGILLHRDDDPKSLAIMNGRVFDNFLQQTPVNQISKLIHTNLHSCFLLDEYKHHGVDSVLGFFEKQNPNQVLTGYRGLTYLNTRFVLSLENLLASGTYILPTVMKTHTVMLTKNNNTIPLGKVDITTVKEYTIDHGNTDLSLKYIKKFNGDETLYVNDINYSPATGESSFSGVGDYLGEVIPNSYFPVAGTPHDYENHIQSTWQEISTLNDDTFYFSMGEYDGMLEEFGEGLSGSTSSLSSRWNHHPYTENKDGFVTINHGEWIEESSVTSRPKESQFTLLFKLSGIQSSSSTTIKLIGTPSSSLRPSSYDTRTFGLIIEDNVLKVLTNKGTATIDSVSLEDNRPYYLSISFIANLGILTISTPDDADFIYEASASGYADLLNPKLRIETTYRSIYADMYQVNPSLHVSDSTPSQVLVFEDQTLNDLKISGSAGTQESTDAYIGSKSISAGSTTSPDWYKVNTVIDDSNHYLGFAAKAYSLTGFSLQVMIGGSIKTINVLDSASNLDDLVINLDNQWHYYIIDLYAYSVSNGAFTQISFQKSGTGALLVDSIYVSSSKTDLASLASISKETSSLEINNDVNNPKPIVDYSYDNTLSDRANNYDAISHSGGFVDDFNDGVKAPEWEYTRNVYSTFTETGGYLEGRYPGGSTSDYDNVWYKKEISTATTNIDFDFSYYIQSGKMGYLAIFGTNTATGYNTFWAAPVYDAWSGSWIRSYTRGFDANGVVTSTHSIQNYYKTSGTGHFTVTFNADNSLTLSISGTIGSISNTYSGMLETDKIEIYWQQRIAYSSTSNYGRIDNYVETGGSPLNFGSGSRGQAIELDGSTSQYLEVPSSVMANTKDFTYATWVKSDDLDHGAGGFNTFISVHQDGWSTNAFMVYIDNAKIRTHFAGSVYDYFATFTDNTWYHIAVIRVGSTLQLYVNGNLVQTRTGVPTNTYNPQYIILGQEQDSAGGTFDPNQSLDGYLDETKFFDYALSNDQVALLYSHNYAYITHEYSLDGNLEETYSSTVGSWYGNEDFSSGMEGSSVDLDGLSYINLGQNIVLENQFSYGIWVKPTAYTIRSDTWKSFPLLGSSSTAYDKCVDLEYYYNGLRFQNDAGAYFANSFSSGVSMDDLLDNWNLITLTYDGTYTKLYLNGIWQSTMTYNLGTTTFNRLGIGYAGQKLSGSLDDFVVFSHALSASDVSALYESYVSTQSYSMGLDKSLSTEDYPTYSFSSTIYNRDLLGTRNVEYSVDIDGSIYGVKLVNGIWKTLDNVVISGISYNAATQYSIDFSVLPNDPYSANPSKILEITLTDGDDSVSVASYSVADDVKIVPQVITSSGYLSDTSISGSSNLGSALYSENAARGSITQGAFALKFEQETYLDYAIVSDIVTSYSNGLFGLVDAFWEFMSCYGVWENGVCNTNEPPVLQRGPYTVEFRDYIYDTISVNLDTPSIKWNDYWFNSIIDLEATSNTGSELELYNDNGVYKFYMNKPLSTLDVEIFIDAEAGDNIKLYRIDSYGGILDTIIPTGYPYSTIIDLNPQDVQYFYMQMDHNVDASKLRLGITPDEPTFNSAFVEYLDGDNSNSRYINLYTGHSASDYPASKSSVSYVRYQVDEMGSHMDPSFSPLTFEDNHYWLGNMVAIGGLPQNVDGFSTLIDSFTYYKDAETGGEKLSAGGSYWKTAINDPEEQNYLVTDFGGDHTIDLTHTKNYMVSYVFESRYRSDVTIEVITTENSQVTMYLDSNTQILIDSTVPNLDPNDSYKKLTYVIEDLSGQLSVLFKVQAERNAYTGIIGWQYVCSNPSITDEATCLLFGFDWESEPILGTLYEQPSLNIKMPNFDGKVGVFEQVDGVEEFVSYPLSSDYVSHAVIGQDFEDSSENERTAASIPYSARPSMDAAAAENPTENRVFDAVLLLEKIVAQYGDFKSLIKEKVYDLLVFTVLGITKTEIADSVWSLLEEYGFGSVERIITWFDNEERLDKLAEVILSDTSLKDALNYGEEGGTMNYAAVAKAGVLVFVDYIHDTYIDTDDYRGTWNWLMGVIGHSGWTLVDVVAGVFSGVSGALSAIKSTITEFAAGVKEGWEYFADNILAPMVDDFVTIFRLILQIFGKIIDAMTPEVPIIETANGVMIGDKEIQIIRDNLDVVIQFMNLDFKISSIFLLPTFDVTETLGGEDMADGVQTAVTILEFLLPISAILLSYHLKQSNKPTHESSTYDVELIPGQPHKGIVQGRRLDYLANPRWSGASQVAGIVGYAMPIAFLSIASIIEGKGYLNAITNLDTQEQKLYFASMTYAHLTGTMGYLFDIILGGTVTDSSPGYAKFSENFLPFAWDLLDGFWEPTAPKDILQSSTPNIASGLLLGGTNLALALVLANYLGPKIFLTMKVMNIIGLIYHVLWFLVHANKLGALKAL